MGGAAVKDLVPPVLVSLAAYGLVAFAMNGFANQLTTIQPDLARFAQDVSSIWYSNSEAGRAVDGVLLQQLYLIS